MPVAPERLLLKNEVDGGARGTSQPVESQASFGGMEAVYRAIKKTASSVLSRRCMRNMVERKPPQHRGQTFAHARVVRAEHGAELSARTKTEEKYTSGRLHEALEKRVTQGRYSEILYLIFSGVFLFFVFLFSPHSFVHNLPLLFPRLYFSRAYIIKINICFTVMSTQFLYLPILARFIRLVLGFHALRLPLLICPFDVSAEKQKSQKIQ